MLETLLHKGSGGSDKVYKLWLVHSAENMSAEEYFNVMYANGRRSSGPTSGFKKKNPIPLTLPEAESFLSFLANKKISEGYHMMGNCQLCGGSSASQVANAFVESLPKKTKTINTFVPAKTIVAQDVKVAPKIPERTVAFDDEDL